ncbi:MAG: tRNA (guanosine(37)-N1)-methyltransferase TrmD [Candidatus Woykebacteria bacterium RIFCSPHIGHO2_12_FULL_45_10]|uniref:tRNA (guanine-N(1)-)-methyltransferase n=1 Tax=Candidatus Woykebacteria bacterium RIFCSPHIGHO2_12_FULL_45_10 TaxID=1802603 RepID=A0A1G1WPA4_9BACT|nr:MAG: tRNA (guanosine(37)-N1)-methyltransferase TrmD [Candidatus Woykebacteria bacterium RIFCSPHIGHO2_12_FULL_45_10]
MPKINFDILTLFPNYFETPLQTSLLGKAIEKKLIGVNLHDSRQFGLGKNKSVDDTPFGGGVGMIMRADVLGEATASILAKRSLKPTVILFDPTGAKLTQKMVKQFSKKKAFLLVCGRYEGIDQRYKDIFVDKEISIGDYIVSGGEVAALVFIEAVSRLVKGVLGEESSVETESFSPKGEGEKQLLLEYPQYTRPRIYRKKPVPDVLLSGDHEKIAEWREKQSLSRTKNLRPDLLKN